MHMHSYQSHEDKVQQPAAYDEMLSTSELTGADQ